MAGRITALDPDPSRSAEASARTFREAPGSDIAIHTAAVAEFDEQPFDLVLSSHVIQHISTAAVTPMLVRLRELTVPNGFLALTYTRGEAGTDRFSIQRIHGIRVRADDVGLEDFDDHVSNGREGLPIHHRDPFLFAEIGRSLGWTQVWSWSFHVLDDLGVLDKYADRDVVVNGSPDLLRRLGRDIIVIWQRRETAD